MAAIIEAYAQRRAVRNATLAVKAARDKVAAARVDGGDVVAAEAGVMRARDDLLLVLAPLARTRLAAVRDAMSNGPLDFRTLAGRIDALAREQSRLIAFRQFASSRSPDHAASIHADLRTVNATLRDLRRLYDDHAQAIFDGGILDDYDEDRDD